MADQVVLYLNRLDGQQAQWLNCSPKGEPNGSVQYGTLAEAAQFIGSRRCSVVIEGVLVHLMRASVPGGNAKRAAAAIPYMLEEQLASDVEELHFALGQKDDEGNYSVAVIANAQMQAIKALLLEAGIVPHTLLPSTLLLPESDDHTWHLLCHAGDCSLHLPQQQGFQLPVALAGFALKRAWDEHAEESVPRLVIHQSAGSPLPELNPSLSPEINTLEAPVLLFAQPACDASGAINLLQGEHSHQQQLDKLWKPWRLTAGLAALWACVALGGQFLEYRALGQQEQQLNAEIEQVFRQAFPDVRRVVDPIQQMRTGLRSLKQQGAPGDFLTLVASLSKSLPKNSPWQLKAISFRNGYCDIDLETQGLQSLDQIKRNIESAGSVRVRIQSANQEGSKVKGRLRLETRT